MSEPLLHIFRAGTYQAMAGQSVTLTPADLAATAAAYDPARHEAPLVVGHPVDNGPAWGWVSGLAAEGEDLRAAPRDVAAELAEAVRARRYAKVSASFWPPTHPANPAPGVWSLRHVGFLGAAVPAVLGLAPVTLSDGRVIRLREPTAGELRGVKLLDVLQLDTASHAVVIERVSELSALEFYRLKPADTMALMSTVVGFFEQDQAFPPA